MKYVKIMLLAILIVSTNASWAQKIKYQSPKVQWITLFKEYVTYKCICEMTNGEIDKWLYKTKDYSYVVQREVLLNFADTADSVGRKFARKIPLLNDDPRDDLYGYKSWFSECIDFGHSKQVDSVAKAEYKKFRKADYTVW